MATNCDRAVAGPSPRTRGFSSWSVRSRSNALEADFVGAGDLGQPAAACLLLAQDHPPVDHVSRPRIPHVLQSHLEPELATELDLDVTDVTGPVDPPRRRGDPDRRHDGQHEEGQRGQALAKRAIQGKHPCLPAGSAIHQRDGSGAAPSARGR